MVGSIASRTFTLSDQIWFADQSRDWNPIHIDPLAARRTLAGEVVVHGIHCLLWALETYFGTGGKGIGISSVMVTFHKPVTLGRNISLDADRDGWLRIHQAGEALTTIRVKSGAVTAIASAGFLASVPARRIPREMTFSELKNLSGSVPVEADAAALVQVWPNLCAAWGVSRVAGLMALSRLVGMEAPGMHSLFSGVDLKMSDESLSEIHWSVRRHTVPQAPLLISVAGSGFSGTITAFARPPPAFQPGMAEVVSAVGGDRFAGQRALIVGGSRGIGEVIAKTVAAGGGQVAITYHQGENEATKIAAEIQAAGGDCRICRFDAEDNDVQSFDALLSGAPTHLYYLASPRIVPSPKNVFDPVKSARFQRVYVDTFARLCLAGSAAAELRVFYPSSVFVDEQPAGYIEYIAAKAAGESVCALLNRLVPNLRVLSMRLPRLRTDQTAALIGKAVAEPLPVVLDIVRKLHRFEKEGLSGG